MKGEYKYIIAPQTVDFTKEITLASLVNLLLTTAGKNADDNDFGIRNLQKLDCTWVLSRLAVEMSCTPSQYETLYIETWIEEVYKLNTTRNFYIKNEKKEIIGQAVSMWVMINFDTRRPMELFRLGNIEQHAEHTGIDMMPPARIEAVNGTVENSFLTRYSDIDINRHVNTTRYLQWMSDCFSLDFHQSHQLKRFDINFMSELVYNEQVKVLKEKLSENEFKIEIVKDSKTSCRGKFIFQ
ncbi:MAG: thioesterase [Paludibacteraceae bacterium]